MKVVSTEKAPAAIGPYSQAMVLNGVVYTSGQIAIDPAVGDDIGNVYCKLNDSEKKQIAKEVVKIQRLSPVRYNFLFPVPFEILLLQKNIRLLH